MMGNRPQGVMTKVEEKEDLWSLQKGKKCLEGM
jgi:hypothetical protein